MLLQSCAAFFFPTVPNCRWLGAGKWGLWQDGESSGGKANSVDVTVGHSFQAI